jgi:hypothetical protein
MRPYAIGVESAFENQSASHVPVHLDDVLGTLRALGRLGEVRARVLQWNPDADALIAVSHGNAARLAWYADLP